MTDFEKQLASNIRAEVRRCKSKGTCGMSVTNLMQITKTPSPSLAGAPAGPAGYQSLFRRVVEGMTIKNFPIYNDGCLENVMSSQ